MPTPQSWSHLLDAARATATPARDAFLADAKKRLEKPLLRRVYRYEDLGQHRSWRDGRAIPLEPEIQKYFALSMSDHAACAALADELPVFAAAYRLTGDAQFKTRVIEQLEESVTWLPLQRSGWCCYQRGSRKPADGKTGSWLATGTGVRGIAATLDIMPASDISASLREKCSALFENEIAEVMDDWKVKRQWFVQSHNVLTNQWVLPTEGLVRACLAVGKDKHKDAYELGVANMLESIDAHGDSGEFEEGLHYASFTVLSMFHTAHAMAVAGDSRALDRPFLKKFSLWVVHHLMPARLGINAFDAFSPAAIPRDHQPTREILSAAATFLNDASARWALADQFDGPALDVAGLAAAPTLSHELPAPPTFAAYERATRVNWRSNWRDDATGLWFRGGHKTDQHDHQDRGHVSFIRHGVPILIETGTPSYHHPDLGTLFGTGAGHNVMQIGLEPPTPGESNLRSKPPRGWQKSGLVAPITVTRLDEKGGQVSIDIATGYDSLARWRRELTWNADTLTIRDEVRLVPDAKEVLLFRWHLAVANPATITGSDVEFKASISGATVNLRADSPLLVTQEPRENHSLALRTWDDPTPYPKHTCLLVRTAEPVNKLVLTTII